MIFGIIDEDFLNPNKVKVIDGIAGAGKSSMIDSFFKAQDIKYMRCTSTNALRRDAEERYDIPCETIAGGLFTTENCKFFLDEKYPDTKVIVIDEILQTSIKVLKWIKNHKGDYNIIITTDTCQMLSQESGNAFLEAFLEYAYSDDCIYVSLKETHRARDQKTKEAYNFLYALVNGETIAFNMMKNAFPVEEFKNIEYNENDVFICHTKEIEEALYREWGLEGRYDLPLIPKGNIARKTPKDITRYPIYSQLKSERHKSVGSYVQIKNIATPTRYQGSEVTENQRLFYVIEKKSIVSNRELYTVLTRCYHMSSMVLVYIDLHRTQKIKEFNGLPVAKYKFYEVKTEEEYKNIKDHLAEDKYWFDNFVDRLWKKESIGKKYYDCMKEVYNPHGFKYEGNFITTQELLDEIEGAEKEYKKPKFSARSLIEKESYFDYTFMDKVYRILDKHDIPRIAYCHYRNKAYKTDYRYDLDLFSAYAAILKFHKLPIDGNIYDKYDKDKMNFFRYKGKELTPNCIITDAIADFIDDKDKEYLFSTDYRIGSKMGDYLWDKAHKTEEDKKSLKNMHYGFWQKPFLEDYTRQVGKDGFKVTGNEWLFNEDNEVVKKSGYYVRVESHNHELIMVAICCEMLAIIIKMLGVCPGYVQVDALHFNNEENVKPLIKFMKETFPNLDYRIEDKEDGKILYKSYEDLQTKADIKREQARLRKQRQRAREREAKKKAEE